MALDINLKFFIQMKTILVPTDFSEAANNAAEYAANLAKKINADVLLFHVYHMPVPVSTEAPMLVISPDDLQKKNEAQLKKEAAHLSKKTNVEVKYMAKMGLAVDEILEEEKNVNLVVMGMKGAGKLSEVLMGSITTATLRKATTPMLIIPEKAEYKNPEKIVFACDYDSRTDMHTLDTLTALMKTFDSKVYVVNVKNNKEPVSVENTMTGLKMENTLSGVEHIYYFPENEDLVEGINEFVEDHHADMVAIIPHRYNLWERLFHKSISKKMAFHSRVPLLALPDNHKPVPAYFI